MQELDNVSIVLVGTTHPGNIGAAARAMKTMGVRRLVLVSPRSFPHEKAIWRAAGAADVVEAALVVDDFEQAVGDCELVIGTSARDRRIPWPQLTPTECGQRVIAEAARHRCALVFGRESRGLTNEELQRCHFHVQIPTAPDYTSLNLAMAVQVLCYELRRAQEGEPQSLAGMEHWDVELASQQHVEHLLAHLEQTLTNIGFHDPQNPRQLLTRLRRMLQRIRPDTMEISILRGILTAIDQKTRRPGE